MKMAEIDWQLFWQAWRQQNDARREQWLERWVFDDQRVRLSMRPIPREKGSNSEDGVCRLSG
jgi:hypothetical protein